MESGSLLLELGGLLLALALAARLASAIGLSPIPLYLAIGLFFGQGGIAPFDHARDFAAPAAQIGLVLLLLMLGLEYNGDELVGALRSSLMVGIVDFVTNFLPGLLAGLLLGWTPLAAVLLGGVTYASSSGIVAKIIADFNRAANRETPVILGVVVLEDLVMAVYLPLVGALLVGGSVLGISSVVLIALGAAGVALFVAIRWSSFVSLAVLSHRDEVLLLSVLGITLVVAGAAEQVKVGAAVGAFLVGIALTGAAAERARPLLSPVRDLFAATYFLFFGLEVAASDLSSNLPIAFALAAITAGTKLATGVWAARRSGIGRSGQLRTGATLIARGEFSIVIAGLAVTANFSDPIGPVAVAYVLILAVVGPVAARFLGTQRNATTR